MTARKLRLLAECLENNFMTAEDRRGWITDLRGFAKDMERSRADMLEQLEASARK